MTHASNINFLYFIRSLTSLFLLLSIIGILFLFVFLLLLHVRLVSWTRQIQLNILSFHYDEQNHLIFIQTRSHTNIWLPFIHSALSKIFGNFTWKIGEVTGNCKLDYLPSQLKLPFYHWWDKVILSLWIFHSRQVHTKTEEGIIL